MALLALLTLPTVLMLVIHNERLQNAVAQKVTTWLSEELGDHVTVKHVEVAWFNRVILNDFTVTDLRGDTLLHAPELIARLNFFHFASKQLIIRKAQLNGASINLAYDPIQDDINLRFIIDKLKSDDTTSSKKPLDFKIETIELKDSYFSYRDDTKAFDRPFGMNYADLRVAHINLQVTNFRLGGAPDYGVKFHIRNLACEEQCGLKLNSFSADFVVNRHNLSFKKVAFTTDDESRLKANDISFNFDSFKDFNNDFENLVKMNFDIVSSRIGFCELAHFAPVFNDYNDYVNVSGKVTGTINDLRGNKIRIVTGSSTDLQCSVELHGLPDVENTFINADVTNLHTCPSDIEMIRIRHSKTGFVELPPAVHQLKNISFKGNFSGFFDDFVTYGVFNTNLGRISTDLSIKPSVASKTDTSFTFEGKLKTKDFDLGRLLGTSSIGVLTLESNVKGMASGPNKIVAEINGKINQIFLRSYPYRDIAINGAVHNRTYNGGLIIDEPNIKMDFTGLVDMTNATFPHFEFNAKVGRAWLHPLKLSADTSAFISIDSATATFSGTNIDNIMGDLTMINVKLRRHSREMEIKELNIFPKEIEDKKRFVLTSDVLTVEVQGKYQFLKLPESFTALVKNYAPAWGPPKVKPEDLSTNDFNFEVNFKETEKLTSFFSENFHISKDSQIKGHYSPQQRNLTFTVEIPSMNVNGRWLRNFYANGRDTLGRYSIEAGCETLIVNKNIRLKNFTLLSDTQSDSMKLTLRWNNWDSLLNRGNIVSTIAFARRANHVIPAINIQTVPSEITTAGDVWQLSHNGIAIDSTALKIHDFLLKRDKQEIHVFGFVSKRPEDKLVVDVKNFDMSTINSSLQFKGLKLDGIANGNVFLSNLYYVPVITSNMHVDSLALNGEMLGNTDLAAAWNSSTGRVGVEMTSIRNDLRTFFLKGNYRINDQSLDFKIYFEQIAARIFQPYIETMFNNITGEMSSTMTPVTLTGTLAHPRLDGEINLENTALTLDYTKARYHFSGTVKVENNIFRFNEFQLLDRFNNIGKMSGQIAVEDLSQLKLDLNIDATRMEVLNTNERDNNIFFGSGFATGKARIHGNPLDMNLDISIRTEKNTHFNIPVNSDNELEQSSFVKYVDKTEQSRKKLYPAFGRRRRQASTDAEAPKMNIKLNVAVTPSADVKLIFDASSGDILRAKGSGDLWLNIGANGFTMSGNYTISQGDYLFTLKSILTNKYFQIEPGSTISWNGDPLNAYLNVKAKHTVNAPLSDLMGNAEIGRSRVPVDCIIIIGNTLSDPSVRFDIAMPNAQSEVRSFLSAATNTEEEMSKQFIWLVATKHFYVDPNATEQRTSGSFSTFGMGSMAMNTAVEVLTNQLSYMASQFSDKFDVNVSYQPGIGDEGQVVSADFSGENWEFSFNSEIGGMRAAEASNSALFDINFERQLGKSGKWSIKAFNRSNDQFFTQSPYTQGVGLLYRESFNRMGDIFRRKQTPLKPKEDDNDSKPKNKPAGDKPKDAEKAVKPAEE